MTLFQLHGGPLDGGGVEGDDPKILLPIKGTSRMAAYERREDGSYEFVREYDESEFELVSRPGDEPPPNL